MSIRHLVQAFCVASMIVGSATASFSEAPALSTQEVSEAQLLELARNQLLSGRPVVALRLMDGILKTRPHLHDAKLIRIDALRRLGRVDEALSAAQIAWRDTSKKSEKTRIARLAAIESYRAGKNTQSKLWLRRALNSAENPVEKSNIIRNYREVRKNSPWSTSYGFSFSPSSNINNGAQGSVSSVDGVADFGTLSEGSRALSGYRLSLSGEARYRWSTDSGVSYSTGIRLKNTFTSLTKEAKALAPTVDGSDYSYGSFDVLFGAQKALSKSTRLGFDLSLGRVYSGGEAYSDVARIGFSHSRGTKRGSRRHGVQLRFENPVDPSRDASKAVRYSYGATTALKNRARLQYQLSGEVLFSDDDRAARRELGAHMSYAPSKKILGTKAEFSLGARMTRYPDYWVPDPASPFVTVRLDVPGGRQDNTLYGGARFTLVEQSYFGFAPEIQINLGKTWSNVSRYDTRTMSVGLGLRSTF